MVGRVGWMGIYKHIYIYIYISIYFFIYIYIYKITKCQRRQWDRNPIAPACATNSSTLRGRAPISGWEINTEAKAHRSR